MALLNQNPSTQGYNDFMKTLPTLDPAVNETSTPVSGGAGGGYGDEVGGAFKGSLDTIKQGAGDINSGDPNPLRLVKGVGRMGAGAIGAAFSPVAPVLNHTIGALTNWLADKISNSHAVQQFSNTGVGKNLAGAAENVANYSTIAGTVGGGLEGGDLAGKVTGTGALGPEDLLGRAREAVTPSIEAAEKEPFQTVPADEAGNPVAPVKGGTKNTIPRIKMNEKGSEYAGVNNTKLEVDAANEMTKSPSWQKLMQDNPDALYKAQQNAIAPDLAAKDAALKSQLASEGTKVQYRSLYGYMTKTLQDLSNKGYAMSEAGRAALDSYTNQLTQSWNDVIAKGNSKAAAGLDEIYKLKQDMTQKYIERQGDTKLGPPDTQLRALDVVQKVGNQAFTDFIDGLAKNTEVKTALKSATDLHNAYDALGVKSLEQAKTYWGRFAQNHQQLAGFGRYAMRYGLRRAVFGLLK